MNPIHRNLDFQVRAENGGDGIVTYCASTQAVDSYSEVICCDGWLPPLKNLPVLDSHGMESIARVIGKVVSARVEKGRYLNVVQFALGVGNDLAEQAYRMVKAGMLPACSVGFYPKTWMRLGDAGFDKKLKELGIPADQEVRTIWTSQQQVELSICPIGANADALVASRSRQRAMNHGSQGNALSERLKESEKSIPFPDLMTARERRQWAARSAGVPFPEAID